MLRPEELSHAEPHEEGADGRRGALVSKAVSLEGGNGAFGQDPRIYKETYLLLGRQDFVYRSPFRLAVTTEGPRLLTQLWMRLDHKDRGCNKAPEPLS